MEGIVVIVGAEAARWGSLSSANSMKYVDSLERGEVLMFVDTLDGFRKVTIANAKGKWGQRGM